MRVSPIVHQDRARGGAVGAFEEQRQAHESVGAGRDGAQVEAFDDDDAGGE